MNSRERDHGENRQVMKLNEDKVGEVGWFKYLRSILQKINGFDEDIRHRIKYEVNFIKQWWDLQSYTDRMLDNR